MKRFLLITLFLLAAVRFCSRIDFGTHGLSVWRIRTCRASCEVERADRGTIAVEGGRLEDRDQRRSELLEGDSWRVGYVGDWVRAKEGFEWSRAGRTEAFAKSGMEACMSFLNWDVFISYAREDEQTVARPLADLLSARGLRVWIDATEIKIGDSLRAKIDEGLANSQFGVVVLSPAFLSKHWPLRELNGLAARESEGEKVILPVWHNVNRADVARESPTLADRVAVDTRDGLERASAKICETIVSASPAGRALRRIQRLTVDLKSLDVEERLSAADGFARLGAAAAQSAPALFEAAIQESDPRAHSALITALKSVGVPTTTVLGEILPSLSTTARISAFKLFVEIGPDAEPATPVLVAALGDPDKEVQESARSALAEIGWSAVPNLLEVLQGAPPFPHNAVRTLIFMKSVAGQPPPNLLSQIIDALAHALDNPDPVIRVLATMGFALLRLDHTRVVPALLTVLKDECKEVRLLAAKGLGYAGPSASAALVPLSEALNDPDADVRSAAVAAITLIKWDKRRASRGLTMHSKFRMSSLWYSRAMAK